MSTRIRASGRARSMLLAMGSSIALLVGVAGAGANAATPPRTTLVAVAEFRADPTGCYETYAVVTVEERAGGGPGSARDRAFVELTYEVRSTCPLGDYLMYYEIHSDGSVEVPEADVRFHPGLLAATIDTTLPVFDEEAGIVLELDLTVSWRALEPDAPGSWSAQAELKVDAPYLSPVYITNPLTTEDGAELTRLPGNR